MPRVFYTEEEVMDMLGGNAAAECANQARGMAGMAGLADTASIGKARAEKQYYGADACAAGPSKPPELSYVLSELEEQTSRLRKVTEELVNRLGPVLDLGPKAETSANECSPSTTTVLGGRIADVTANLRQLQRLVRAANSSLEI